MSKLDSLKKLGKLGGKIGIWAIIGAIMEAYSKILIGKVTIMKMMIMVGILITRTIIITIIMMINFHKSGV